MGSQIFYAQHNLEIKKLNLDLTSPIHVDAHLQETPESDLLEKQLVKSRMWDIHQMTWFLPQLNRMRRKTVGMEET